MRNDPAPHLQRAAQRATEALRRELEIVAQPISDTIGRTLIKTTAENIPGRLGFRASVRSPYFWSEILNSGARRYEARPGKWLAWYREPKAQDPRLGGTYFRDYADARRAKLRLPYETFRRHIAEGKLVLRKVRDRVPPTHFVNKAVQKARPEVRRIHSEMARGMFTDVLKKNRTRALVRVRF